MALVLKVIDGPNLYLLEHGLFDPKPGLVEIMVEYGHEGGVYWRQCALKLTGVHRFSNDWMFDGIVEGEPCVDMAIPQWVKYNIAPGTEISISNYDPTKRTGQIDNIREV